MADQTKLRIKGKKIKAMVLMGYDAASWEYAGVLKSRVFDMNFCSELH